ncbi:hypothetical protein C8R46DRAFT_1120634, partial [Mycena filopes]
MSKTEIFYVDKVLEAKVEINRKGGAKKGRKCWLYLTTWDGYPDPEDRTWEPESSFFNKSVLRIFWTAANCTRDHKRISLFKIGEVIRLNHNTVKPRSKPGPGRSSVGLLGTRVFALSSEDGNYYSASVQERVGDDYVVRFDGGKAEATLPLKHLRECNSLEAGDSVNLLRDNAVVAAFTDDGGFVAQKVVDYTTIRISRKNIQQEWEDRELEHDDIMCV